MGRWLACVLALIGGCVVPPSETKNDAGAHIDAPTLDAPAADAAVPDATASVDAAVNIDATAPDAPSLDAMVVTDAPTVDGSPDATPVACSVNDASAADAIGTGTPPPPFSGPVVELTPSATAARNVHTMALAPTGDVVVFVGDLDVDGVRRLYAVPIDGGSRVTLSHNTSDNPDLDVHEFAISPDGSRVVFMGDAEVDQVVRLYSVPISGGAVTTLSQNTGSNPDLQVDTFRFSPDGATVLFSGDTVINDFDRLYAVPVDGGQVTLLTHAGSPGSVSGWYGVSPDGSRVVFVSTTEQHPVSRVHSVPIGGGAIETLSHIATDPDLRPGQPRISPDGQWVVFSGNTEHEHIVRLYAVPIDGGTITTLSQNTGTTPGLDVEGWAITPDSEGVVFRGDTEVPGVDRLYWTAIDGGGAITLSHNTTDDDDLDVTGLHVAPDSRTVVFTGDLEINDVTRLYSVPICGGPVATLSHNTEFDTQLDVGAAIMITADAATVVFGGDPEVDDVYGMWSVPIGGGDVVPLSGNTEEGTVAAERILVGDGETIVYIAILTPGTGRHVYRVPLLGGSSVAIGPGDGLDPTRELRFIGVTPGGEHVVMLGDPESDGVDALYSRPL